MLLSGRYATGQVPQDLLHWPLATSSQLNREGGAVHHLGCLLAAVLLWSIVYVQEDQGQVLGPVGGSHAGLQLVLEPPVGSLHHAVALWLW